MKDYGSYVVVEGDIRLEKAILLRGLESSTEVVPSVGKQVPQKGIYQYSTNIKVSAAFVRQITVDLTNINALSNWASAVRTAIDAYNASGSGIFISESSPGDITYSSVSSINNGAYIAVASWPYGSGKPGPTVTIAEDYNYLQPNQKQLTMAHELGHTLGLRHDNVFGIGEEAGSEGANLVPGTPQQDFNSIMRSALGSSTWVGFSQYDLVALRTLYPAGPLLTATFNGPTYTSYPQRCDWSISAAGGTPPFTYSIRILDPSFQPQSTTSAMLTASVYTTSSNNYTVNYSVTDATGQQINATRMFTNTGYTSSDPYCHY